MKMVNGTKRGFMDVEDLKNLERKATPRPWKGRELVCYGRGQATGPGHEIPDDVMTTSDLPWAADCRLIALTRNLMPELLDLWAALNEWERLKKIAGRPVEARSYEGGLMMLTTHIREAEWVARALLDALNEKAASLNV